MGGSPVTPITSVAPSRPCETTPRPGDSPGPTPSSTVNPSAMCPCYPPGMLGYSRVAGLGEPSPAAAAAALYGSAYPGGYLPLGTDPSGLLTSMVCHIHKCTEHHRHKHTPLVNTGTLFMRQILNVNNTFRMRRGDSFSVFKSSFLLVICSVGVIVKRFCQSQKGNWQTLYLFFIHTHQKSEYYQMFSQAEV